MLLFGWFCSFFLFVLFFLHKSNSFYCLLFTVMHKFWLMFTYFSASCLSILFYWNKCEFPCTAKIMQNTLTCNWPTNLQQNCSTNSNAKQWKIAKKNRQFSLTTTTVLVSLVFYSRFVWFFFYSVLDFCHSFLIALWYSL